MWDQRRVRSYEGVHSVWAELRPVRRRLPRLRLGSRRAPRRAAADLDAWNQAVAEKRTFEMAPSPPRDGECGTLHPGRYRSCKTVKKSWSGSGSTSTHRPLSNHTKLTASERQSHIMLESITDGFFALDQDGASFTSIGGRTDSGLQAGALPRAGVVGGVSRLAIGV